MANNNNDINFFIKQIRSTVLKNKGKIGDQREQFELMISLERKFQHYVCKYAQSKKIYKKFILYVKKDLGNILKSKGFFREKKDVFSKYISKAIKNDDYEEIMRHQLNYNLAMFIVDNWVGEMPKYPKRYFEELTRARQILIENNTPLAINRAKKFHSSQNNIELDLNDFIGICMYGLIVGIDKFVGSYSKKLISVSIGRMVGFMIKENSKTLLRMYPSDHKILYRANSLKKRLKITNIDILTKAVNESFAIDKKNGVAVPTKKIDNMYITTLINASHSFSVVRSFSGSDGSSGESYSLYDITPDDNEGIEEGVIKRHDYGMMHNAIKKLGTFDRKLISLTGVSTKRR